MNLEETILPGVFIIKNKIFSDQRGVFTKCFQKSQFALEGLDIDLSELFYSVSAKSVIRGMHFQKPPYSQEKIIYVPKGRILDIILDLRKESPSYLKHISVELSEENRHAIFVPKGCAHGFQSLEEGTITVYSQSFEYDQASDSGINPLSLKIEWPISNYIISEKDKSLINLTDFISPF